MRVDAHDSPRGFQRGGFPWGLLFWGILLVLAGCATGDPLAELASKSPDPSLTPEEVVRIQMNAFRNNDAEDRGIEIAFRFASPANRRLTGPLPRFARMMRTVLYEPMLVAEEVEVSAAEIRGNLARVNVSLRTADGSSHRYVFFLTKQIAGDYAGSWMTEGVSVPDNRRAPGSGSVV